MKHGPLKGHLAFRLMALGFRFRDGIWPPARILRETGMGPGMAVLDFGCGPGGFALAAARLVGPEGLVYALDIHPLAERYVRRAAEKDRATHIRPVSAPSGIPSASIDVALLYDVLHELPDPETVPAGLHGVLKPGALLSARDRYLGETELAATVTGRGLFRPAGRGRWTHGFRRAESGGASP